MFNVKVFIQNESPNKPIGIYAYNSNYSHFPPCLIMQLIPGDSQIFYLGDTKEILIKEMED
jgi:hypothetical protein